MTEQKHSSLVFFGVYLRYDCIMEEKYILAFVTELSIKNNGKPHSLSSRKDLGPAWGHQQSRQGKGARSFIYPGRKSIYLFYSSFSLPSFPFSNVSLACKLSNSDHIIIVENSREYTVLGLGILWAEMFSSVIFLPFLI